MSAFDFPSCCNCFEILESIDPTVFVSEEWLE